MCVTVYQRTNEQVGIAVGGTLFARAADFDELFRELVEEAGRALEAGDLEWCALLQEVFIPQIEAESLTQRLAS